MGLGDAKLTLSIGWILGLGQGFTTLAFAFWIGGAFGILLMLYERWCGKNELSREENEHTMKSELPLAPFLILGFALVYLTGLDFFTESTLFWKVFN
jgi:prepilin signal peptidase PulO-like enzyme (type II secretory pathway)